MLKLSGTAVSLTPLIARQLYSGDLNFFAVELSLTFSIDFLHILSHMSPSVALSTIKSVLNIRINSD